MATVGQVNDQDAFTCPICLETLKTPKSLPCNHTFCETCIGEFILSTELRAEKKLCKYPCPVCRTIVTPTNQDDNASQWAASLPHNFAILSLMDNSKSVKQECHLCKRRDKISEATQWCRDCAEALCEECLQLHSFMKLFADHKVVQIDEMNFPSIVKEPNLGMLSDSCPIHTSKVLEAFCFDHQKLCCVLCLTLQHRKCKDVQAIEEMQNLKNVKMSMLLSEVNAIKVKVGKVMKEKNGEKEKLDISFTEIEAEASQFISTLKDKLDSLLASFIKGMNMYREESGNAFENKLKTFEKLSKYFDQLKCTTKNVQKHGTLNQMFIHFEKSKTEIKSGLTGASSVLNTSSISEAKLVKSAKLDQVENIEDIFELELIKTIPVDLNAYVKQLFPSGSSVLSKTDPLSSFDCILLKHIKTIALKGFDVYGGVFVSDEVIVAGGIVEGFVGKIQAINLLDKRIVHEYPLPTLVKRLAFDFESKSLFLSCYGSKMYRFKVSNAFHSEMTIKDNNQRNGGICIYDGTLYVIVEETVQKISLKNVQLFKKCFETNTSCRNLNGLEIDSKNNRLLYTSENSEVVCTSFDGEEIFKYKDEFMEETTSVSVHSAGIIFLCDEYGQIRIISEDGQQSRTVLNCCHKLKKVRDLCFDKSSTRLAVFGSSYIELYDVCA
ncbi:tripartite motif-containing protein 2/3 [Mytilus galloprovincialis]|uniref:Tripartite motif-containing protein 2/3 n=1 Tax=Mytilus galloprovincialis TaxID=29158 RepID=A0A8B6FMG4_MYTGA|nr:tripartite motif-containing protein 2/3 [Mytilus galloprovincialis]